MARFTWWGRLSDFAAPHLERFKRWEWLAAFLAAYVASVLALGLIVSHHLPWPLIGLTALVVGVLGIVVHNTLNRLEHRRLTPGRKVAMLLVVTELGVILCVVKHLEIFSSVGFVGLSLAALGVGQLATEIRKSESFKLPIAVFLCGNWLGAWGLGLAGKGGWPVLIAGLILTVPVLSITMELLLGKFDRGSTWVWAVFGTIFSLGAVLLWPIGGFVFLIVAALLLFAVVGMSASNTNVDMLFIVVAFAVGWSQYPRPAGTQTVPDETPAIVVLGDSYISGEGAGRYYERTNDKSPPAKRNECRRSPTSYPVLTAEAMGVALDNFACSGAKVRNLTGSGQYLGENPEEMRDADPITGLPPPKLGQLELFDLRKRDLSRIQHVLVSIGGNDAGFGDLVQACIAPGDCSERGQHWLDRLETLASELAPLYNRLRTTFGDRVVVVPYPVPIRETGCGIFDSTFTDGEHAFINGFAKQLDRVIKEEAAKAQLRYLAEMENVFVNGARICDTSASEAGVNYLALNPVGGKIDPTGWLHNSMHPNTTGHRMMATVAKTWLEGPRPVAQSEAATAAVKFTLPEVVKEASPTIAVEDDCNRGSPASDCQLSDSVWILKQTRHALLRHVLALVLLACGAQGLWFCILRRLRKKREEKAEMAETKPRVASGN